MDLTLLEFTETTTNSHDPVQSSTPSLSTIAFSNQTATLAVATKSQILLNDAKISIANGASALAFDSDSNLWILISNSNIECHSHTSWRSGNLSQPIYQVAINVTHILPSSAGHVVLVAEENVVCVDIKTWSQVSINTTGKVTAGAWSVKGKQIALASREGIYTYKTDGTRVKELQQRENDRNNKGNRARRIQFGKFARHGRMRNL
jgi:hypothetical protein